MRRGKSSFKRSVTWSAIALAVALFLGYGAFEARKLIQGPEIAVSSPRAGSAVGGPTVEIRGVVHNVTFFTIDGKQAFADQNGNFAESLTPPVGYAMIEIVARDRFGRTAVRDIPITVLDYCIPTQS